MALGYDFYVYGKSKKWKPAQLVDDLKASPDLLADARTRLAEVEKMLKSGRKCFVSETQKRILTDALAAA